MSVNKVILVGHLGKDPELRYTTGGAAVATWTMATNRKYKNRDGALIEDTQWHNVKVWQALAETCEKHLSRGRHVYVEGRLESREYEKDGVKKYWTEVIANTVQFLDGRGNGSAASGPAVEPMQAYDDGDIPF